jgi:hypothetical protein
MPSQALSDPREERAANDAIDWAGRRCPVCHAPVVGHGGRKYCRRFEGDARCRMFAWRRDGDPDGPLNPMKARAG